MGSWIRKLFMERFLFHFSRHISSVDLLLAMESKQSFQKECLEDRLKGGFLIMCSGNSLDDFFQKL